MQHRNMAAPLQPVGPIICIASLCPACASRRAPHGLKYWPYFDCTAYSNKLGARHVMGMEDFSQALNQETNFLLRLFATLLSSRERVNSNHDVSRNWSALICGQP